MNEPEETMPDATHTQNSGLVAHRIALEAAARALRLAETIRSPYRSLSDQVVRAAASVPANLSEGAGRSKGDRQYHWRIAYGSALEVGSHLELLLNAEAINADRGREAIALFDRVRALTWRLLHPRR